MNNSSTSRLSFIKSRFAALRSGIASSVSPEMNLFRPIPAGRHAETCGGTVFRKPIVAEVVQDEPFSGPLPTVEEFHPAIDPVMAAENAAFVAAWTRFELDSMRESEKLLLMA